ncbi:unnamed protein product [Effrenium voratum]|nr:unnamed protein product [Effrenium voratum]
MCARSKPTGLSSPKADTKILELQLQKILSASSHLQVHAHASLKLLLRKKLRSKSNVPETPTPLPLPKVLQEEEDTQPSTFKRQISAPAAVQQQQNLDQVAKELQPEEDRTARFRGREAKSALLHAVTCPGVEQLSGLIPVYWPNYVLELFQNARRDMPFVSLTESGFRLLCGAFQMPHPQKASTGGEDSLFVCPNGSAAGVADGVGEWQWRFGLDPRAFADELMPRSKNGVLVGLAAETRAALMLSEGYQATSSFGSATALVAALDPSGEAKLGVANLGDSGLRVLRWSEPSVDSPNSVHIAYRTSEQQHAFNCPFQLARLPEPKAGGKSSRYTADYAGLRAQGMGSLVRAVEKSGCSSQDLPASADAYTFEVQEGDVVLLGTDGFFDNLHDAEVCELAHLSLEARQGAQVLLMQRSHKSQIWQTMA